MSVFTGAANGAQNVVNTLNIMASAMEKIQQVSEIAFERSEQNFLSFTQRWDSFTKVVTQELQQQTSYLKSINLNILKLRGDKVISDTKTDIQDDFSGRNKNFKISAWTILLIAGAIWAIGSAFKTVKDLDTKSVITLAGSLLVITYTFDKLSQIRGIRNPVIMGLVGWGVKIMAGVIVSVSQIFQYIAPVSIAKLASGVAVAYALMPIVMVFNKILAMTSVGFWDRILHLAGSMRGLDAGPGLGMRMANSLVVIPLLAVAVAMSSWAFKITAIPKISQLVSAGLSGFALIPIASAFTIIITGSKTSDVFGKGTKESMRKIALVAAALPIMAYGIVLAAIPLGSMNVSIPLKTALSIWMMGMALKPSIKLFKDLLVLNQEMQLKPTEVKKIAIMLPIIAMAMVVTSFILNRIDDGFTYNMGRALVFMTIGMLPATLLFDRFKPFIKDEKLIMKAAILMPMMALTLASIAFIFNKFLPTQFDAPPLEWIIKTGILIWIFSKAIQAIGTLKPTRIIFAALAIPLLAGAIAFTAYIFNKFLPDPSKLQPIPVMWGVSIGITIAVFGLATAIIGRIPLPVLAIGSLGILLIGTAIAGLAWILSYMPERVFAKGGVIYQLTDAFNYFILGFIRTLAQAPLEPFVVFVMGIGRAIADFAKLMLPVIKQVIEFILPQIINVFNVIVDGIVRAKDVLIPLLKGTFDIILMVISKGVDLFISLFDKISSIISSVMVGINTALKTFTDTFKFIITQDATHLLAVGGGLLSVAAGIGAVMAVAAGSSVIDLASSALGGLAKGIKFLTGQEGTPTSLIDILGGINKHMDKFVKYQTPIQKMSVSFEKIAKSMGVFKTNINAINPEIIKNTAKLIDSAGIIIEDESSITNKISNAISSGVSNLASAVTSLLKGDSKSSTTTTANMDLTPLIDEIQTLNNSILQLALVVQEGNISIKSSLNGVLKTKSVQQ